MHINETNLTRRANRRTILSQAACCAVLVALVGVVLIGCDLAFSSTDNSDEVNQLLLAHETVRKIYSDLQSDFASKLTFMAIIVSIIALLVGSVGFVSVKSKVEYWTAEYIGSEKFSNKVDRSIGQSIDRKIAYKLNDILTMLNLVRELSESYPHYREGSNLFRKVVLGLTSPEDHDWENALIVLEQRYSDNEYVDSSALAQLIELGIRQRLVKDPDVLKRARMFIDKLHNK